VEVGDGFGRCMCSYISKALINNSPLCNSVGENTQKKQTCFFTVYGLSEYLLDYGLFLVHHALCIRHCRNRQHNLNHV